MLGEGDRGGREGIEGAEILGARESCSLIVTSTGEVVWVGVLVIRDAAASSLVGNGGFMDRKPSQKGDGEVP